MKNILPSVFCLCLTFHLAAQDTSNKALQSLVDSERAFAKLALDKNTKEAFLANLSDESISIEQGALVKVKKIWEERKADSARLEWKPIYADVAASGDFGYTTGPWQYRPSKNAEPVAFGQFVTVWKMQPHGEWRIVIDIGVTHQQPDKTSTLTFSSISQKSIKNGKSAAGPELIDVEKNFIQSLTGNSMSAYQKNQSREMRLYRSGYLPFTTQPSIQQQLTTEIDKKFTFHTLDGGTAPSGDLGFAVGTVESNQSGKDAAKGKYLRIWKKEDGNNWKLVLDLISF